MSLDDHMEKIFDEAGLSEGDRALWRSRLAAADERMRAVFVSIFSGDTELLAFFTEDLRDRVAAGRDPEKLANVLEKEREHFRSMLAGSKTE
ncbi:MAG: hypothetical protein KBD19_03885 [Candidatus Moranbacteria bacterium]|nr:hypothetical protein [Candidatus Moranbacteria bacterium]